LPGYADALAALNAGTGPEDRTLFLWEPRTYHAVAPARGDQILDQWRRSPLDVANARDIPARLREDGFSYVLLNRLGLDFLLRTGHDPIDPTAVDRLVESQEFGLTLVYGVGLARDPAAAGITQSQAPYAIYRVSTDRTTHGGPTSRPAQ
jgi:hypothetical protein